MAKKRMPVRRKATGNRGHCGGDPRRRSRITGRIRADARPERALTWPGGLVENRSQVAPEPKDKLDAMTLDTLEPACARPAVDAVVNGPEGECPDWLSIDWRQAEDDVRRLRQRIFTASRAGDLKRVRSLQRLMLRSRANAVVQRAPGGGVQRRPPDGGRRREGLVVGVPEGRAGRLGAATVGPVVAYAGAAGVHPQGQRETPPARYSSDRRQSASSPDGQRTGARVEARFEPKSYGFRPGRGCHDAIEAIFTTVGGRNPHRRWILDADLVAALESSSHCSFR